MAGNLLCLCSGCHRNHHNGYLKIEVENGELIFRDRKGRRLDREAHIELASWIDFRLGWGGEENDCYRRRYQTGDWGVSSYSPGVLGLD